jgi:hypothetical protein
MNVEERFNEILSEFAKELELDPSGMLMEDGYTNLSVDAAKVVHMRLPADANDVDVFMELGVVPQAVRAQVCEDMLQANVLCQATEGAALGLDAERDVATLTMRLGVAGMELAYFKDRLEGFLDAARFWEQRIAGPQGEPGGDGDGPAPDLGANFMRV